MLENINFITSLSKVSYSLGIRANLHTYSPMKAHGESSPEACAKQENINFGTFLNLEAPWAPLASQTLPSKLGHGVLGTHLGALGTKAQTLGQRSCG